MTFLGQQAYTWIQRMQLRRQDIWKEQLMLISLSLLASLYNTSKIKERNDKRQCIFDVHNLQKSFQTNKNGLNGKCKRICYR